MSRRRRTGLLLVLLGVLDGCASALQRDPPAPPANAGLPAGAIAVGPELYQVPIGEDQAGCPMYRLYSPTRLVSQAIAYPKPGGGFTADRRAADCPG